MADLFDLELHDTDNVDEESEDDAIDVDGQVSLTILLIYYFQF